MINAEIGGWERWGQNPEGEEQVAKDQKKRPAYQTGQTNTGETTKCASPGSRKIRKRLTWERCQGEKNLPCY